MTGHVVSLALKARPFAPMEELEFVDVSIEAGLAGDFRGAAPDRQVTVVFEDDWLAACAALGRTLPWTTRRANILLSGLINPRRSGDLLRVGEIILAITGETHPCGRMEKQAPGLRAALEPSWRCGVTARVVRGGVVRTGDAATLEIV
jgi:MOSC domain-containing protein YiiM